MEIYLDHAATTPIAPEVVSAIEKLMHEDFGNPSSMHKKGVIAEKYIKEARKKISKALQVNEKEILFTSGGTESNNLAIKGSLPRKLKGRIVTTRFEHPSVKSTVEVLGKNGYEVIFLPIDKDGQVHDGALDAALTPDTLLVSIMHVNNEIGSIQPIEAYGKTIHAYNQTHGTKIIFHVDAIQSFGKIQIPIQSAHIDLLSFSGHKICGIKGSGGLFVRSGVHLAPLLDGGQQELGIRPGTENIFGIVALGRATELAFEQMKSHFDETVALNVHLKSLLEKDERIHFNCPGGSPYIINVSFAGVKGEVMLHSLEMEGIYVSTGSACSSKKKNYSHVLEAIGLSDEHMDSAIRISFGSGITTQNINEAAEKMLSTAASLRKIMKNRR
ncbi:MAG: cysteine desulfurase family protein [Bacillota bacterium]|nr:cysteine desulfurase family protein [Bacillota bacterium]